MYQKSNREFKGGYVPIHEAMILELIGEYRVRRAGFKNLVRVFAAMAEEKGLHARSKVDLYRIVNCKSAEQGCRRLSQSQIDTAGAKVGAIAENAKTRPERRKRPISRKILRAIAQGRLSSSEAIVTLFYAARRISQGKRAMLRLNQEERYARFKYADLQELTGIEKARIGEAVSKLRDKGYLHVVEVHQSNVNAYGLCFVDGWLISLCRTAVECVRKVVRKLIEQVKKTATPSPKNSTPPRQKTATLRNENPKTSMKENKIRYSHLPWFESALRTMDRLSKRAEDEIPQTA